MATNRDLLKEAIADAKTVKNMAIANAKAALEESFTPQLTSMLSQKIQEMDMYEKEEEVEEEKMTYEGEKEDEDLNLEEILAELEEEDEDKDLMKEEDDAEDVEDEAEDAKDDAEEAEDDADEALDLEDMTEDSLKKFIEDVIADMVETGGLEAGDDIEGEEVEVEDEFKVEDEDEEVDINELIAEIESLEKEEMSSMDEEMRKDDMDEAKYYEDDMEESEAERADVDKYEYEKGKEAGEELDEIFGLGKKSAGGTSFVKDFIKKNSMEIDKIKTMDDEKQRLTALKPLIMKFMKENGSKMDSGAMRSDVSVLRGMADVAGLGGASKGSVSTAESLQRENKMLRSKLKEVKAANGVLNSELNEINLLNSKLLYTNKIFKGKNLTESQKVKVLSTFDKASNVKEAKLIFETFSDSFKTTKKSINENYGSASSMLRGTSNKKPIIPVDDAFRRMKELAFYDKKH